MTDIIVVGAGPAGLTAAIYALRAGKSVTVLEKGVFGGQMTFSPKIENYPGYPAISGNELAEKMLEQALNLGADIQMETVTAVQDENGVKQVITEEGVWEAKSVIISVGAAHRRLHIEGEERFLGNGISFCAVCDGAFYKNAEVLVVGGGNSAMQEALLLSELCKKVTVIQNLAAFTGEQTLINKIQKAENISVLFNSSVSAYLGEKELTGVELTNLITGEKSQIRANGVFLAIGLSPATKPFANLLSLNEYGYVAAGEDTKTNLPGIFTAGDCRQKQIRQITTAAADGAIAAMAACSYIDNM